MHRALTEFFLPLSVEQAGQDVTGRPRSPRWARWLLSLVFAASTIAGALAWAARDEDIHAWVFPRTEDATAERMGEFSAALSLRRDLRLLLPLAAVLSGLAWLLLPALGGALGRMRPEASDLCRRLGWIGSATVVVWAFTALGHLYGGFSKALDDWPVYRLYPGEQILPNMSEGNRRVIRALRRATPPDARILVTTDQKPGFLSYYLLPRRVCFKTHPDSEFVIPGPSEPLPAYRVGDLDPAWIASKKVDTIVEYFEAPRWRFTVRRRPPARRAP